MERAVIVVSFGTTVPEAEKAIINVEEELAAAYPDRKLLRAYTSRIICRILKERGKPVMSPEEAFVSLINEGCREVIVQPTHLTPGDEYEKLCAIAENYRSSFDVLTIGKPLISCPEDMLTVAKAVLAHYPVTNGALLLMGHGTGHIANMIYPAMQTAFRLLGADNVIVGTVEGWPELTDCVKQLKERGCRRVTLAPLMLVAGDHARNDMAGDEKGSWKNVLAENGIAALCRIEGIGEWPEIAALCRRHLEEAEAGVK